MNSQDSLSKQKPTKLLDDQPNGKIKFGQRVNPNIRIDPSFYNQPDNQTRVPITQYQPS